MRFFKKAAPEPTTVAEVMAPVHAAIDQLAEISLDLRDENAELTDQIEALRQKRGKNTLEIKKAGETAERLSALVGE